MKVDWQKLQCVIENPSFKGKWNNEKEQALWEKLEARHLERLFTPGSKDRIKLDRVFEFNYINFGGSNYERIL